jgi:hypothetical protein
MWELSNRTRFAAERVFVRDRDGSEVLLVAVKATFAIGQDGALRVADEQIPVERVPRHSGDPVTMGETPRPPARSSLLYDADFALVKRATDVLVVGHAHALHAKPSIAVMAGVRVGAWQKRVLVVGDRRWDRGISGWWLTDPEPFVTMPLVYERAFGGGGHDGGDQTPGPAGHDGGAPQTGRAGGEIAEYAANPVGKGFARWTADLAGRPAPNLEDPSDPLRSPDQRPRPMSFGPIAREWPERRRLAGTYDERWRRERRPLVPEDFDDAFWQSAPPDQRASLKGGEEVELTGLHPRGTLRFELPRIRLSLRTRLGGRIVEHAPSLHTVLFEPDQDRVVLVFQSALPCHHEIQSLEQTVVREVA